MLLSLPVPTNERGLPVSTDIDKYTTITNTCTCVSYNEDTHEWDIAPECWGDCWECMFEAFSDDVQTLLDKNDELEGRGYRIDGFPTWYGSTSGWFIADDARDILDSITPNRTEWTLRYTIENGELIGSLSHHDGSGRIVVKPIGELQ